MYKGNKYRKAQRDAEEKANEVVFFHISPRKFESKLHKNLAKIDRIFEKRQAPAKPILRQRLFKMYKSVQDKIDKRDLLNH